MILNLVCPKCGAVVTKAEKEKLVRNMGKKLKCKSCGDAVAVAKNNIRKGVASKQVANPRKPNPQPKSNLKVGKYVSSTLASGEVAVYVGHISLWSLATLIIAGVLLTPILGLGIIVLVWARIVYKSTEIAITNKKIIAKTGFVRRDTIEMKLKNVESLQVEQGIMGRMFNFGTIVISGAGNPQAPIVGISSPMKFRKAFFDAQENFLK